MSFEKGLIEEAVKATDKIQAIKAVRELIADNSLKGAKEYVERFWGKSDGREEMRKDLQALIGITDEQPQPLRVIKWRKFHLTVDDRKEKVSFDEMNEFFVRVANELGL